jgi:hypothetical protein
VPFEAAVSAVDELQDLAVLITEGRLSASAGSVVATDSAALAEPIVVTGVSEVDDPGHEYRYLDALGTWTGGTTRDDELPLGRLQSNDFVLGMSGAPVRRLSDDAVVGVALGRYNSADGWLAGSVWVAHTERLGSLLRQPPLNRRLDGVAVVADGPRQLHERGQPGPAGVGEPVVEGPLCLDGRHGHDLAELLSARRESSSSWPCRDP